MGSCDCGSYKQTLEKLPGVNSETSIKKYSEIFDLLRRKEKSKTSGLSGYAGRKLPSEETGTNQHVRLTFQTYLKVSMDC